VAKRLLAGRKNGIIIFQFHSKLGLYFRAFFFPLWASNIADISHHPHSLLRLRTKKVPQGNLSAFLNYKRVEEFCFAERENFSASSDFYSKKMFYKLFKAKMILKSLYLTFFSL
jgi:hypothetical protein